MCLLHTHIKNASALPHDLLNPDSEDIRIYRAESIMEINPAQWDSINTDPFKSYDFLLSIEKAGIENSRIRYLLFFADEELVGSAVLSSFYISLDLIAGDFIQKTVLAIRKLFPSFFKIKFLFCGTPISIGKDNISVKYPVYRDEIIRMISMEMSAIAAVEKIPFQSVKEFPEKEAAELSAFSRYNFILVNTIPYMKLNIRWKDFNSFLKDMHHSYRRQIKSGLRKLGLSEPEIYTGIPADGIKTPYLLLTGTEKMSAQDFYSLYMQVMQKAKNKLEVLNREFFENIFDLMKNKIEILSLTQNDKKLGSAIINHDRDKITFVLVGFEHKDVQKYDTYFNIVYGLIYLAIQRKCTLLDMGQTSYYFKQRCGAVPADSLFFIKSDNKIIHTLLKTFRKIIFPKLTLNTYHVFKSF